jgi:cbb3-type cytochrome oxidase maturation protein
MNIVILLIFSSVIAATIFLIAFLWAARSGQYDDVHTPAVRMLFEDQPTDKRIVTDDAATEIHSHSQHGT